MIIMGWGVGQIDLIGAVGVHDKNFKDGFAEFAAPRFEDNLAAVPQCFWPLISTGMVAQVDQIGPIGIHYENFYVGIFDVLKDDLAGPLRGDGTGQEQRAHQA